MPYCNGCGTKLLRIKLKIYTRKCCLATSNKFTFRKTCVDMCGIELNFLKEAYLAIQISWKLSCEQNVRLVLIENGYTYRPVKMTLAINKISEAFTRKRFRTLH